MSGFKEQVSQEEVTALAADTFTEVATKSNFYFSYDAQKVKKNLRVANMNAPGNKYRHPNVILPHEHVDVQHFVDGSSFTPEKLNEIYAYYSLMVDMHIAQIRPGQVEEASYIPPHLTQVSPDFKNPLHLNNMFWEHFHRWREPAKRDLYSIEKRWKAQLDARPQTTHYNHGKGSKYDVEWTEDQKFPHVATRLGYPIMKEEVFERIVGLERAQASPGFQFQPFVQTPPMEPDAALNFERGEVIYENTKVAEWVKFWKACAFTVFGLSPGFYIFEIYAGDGAPSLDWMTDNWNSWAIPRQFQDGGDWDLETYRYPDDRNYMNVQYGVKRSIVRPVHTMYWFSLLTMFYNIDQDYVTKMTYNKDKDLVFVTKPSGLWGETETVYEVHHLEQMIPAPITAIPDMSANHKNGILTVRCMAQNENLKFYRDEKYWNSDVKQEFFHETTGLWQGNFTDKYNGKIFNTRGPMDKDIQLAMDKVDREMVAAMEKHGPVTLPENLHIDEFYQNIERKKQEVARA